MEKLTRTRIKGIQLLLFAVVILMLFFGGCGEQESDDGVELENMAVSLSGGVDISTMGTEEWKESQSQSGAMDLSEPEPKMELNHDLSTVAYQGTPFMSSCRTIGGDGIYSAGYLGEFDGGNPADGPYFVGRIGMEEDNILQFPLEIPVDMTAYRGCVDSQGRWHLLLAQKSGETAAGKKMEIWVINRDGELEESHDITDYTEEGVRIPGWMEVDEDGNYYFASGGSILVVDVADHSVQLLHFGGEIIGLGRGRSGALYGVFSVEGNDFLGVIDAESGSIRKCADFPENDVRPKFSVLQAGVNMELLLANMEDGVWSYDGTELKQEMTLDDIVANGQDILAMGFLWDGRVCVMSYEAGQKGHYLFHYVPIET